MNIKNVSDASYSAAFNPTMCSVSQSLKYNIFLSLYHTWNAYRKLWDLESTWFDIHSRSVWIVFCYHCYFDIYCSSCCCWSSCRRRVRRCCHCFWSKCCYFCRCYCRVPVADEIKEHLISIRWIPSKSWLLEQPCFREKSVVFLLCLWWCASVESSIDPLSMYISQITLIFIRS